MEYSIHTEKHTQHICTAQKLTTLPKQLPETERETEPYWKPLLHLPAAAPTSRKHAFQVWAETGQGLYLWRKHKKGHKKDLPGGGPLAQLVRA